METPCQLQIVRLFTTCCWWLGVSEKLQRNTTKLGVSEKTQQQLKSFSLKITSKKKKKQKKKKKVGTKKKKEKSALRGEVLGGQYGPPTVHRCCKSLNPHLSSSQGAVDPHTHTRMALFDPVTFYRIASRIKWAWYNDLVYEVRRLPGKKTMQLPLSNCLWVLIQEWVNVKL